MNAIFQDLEHDCNPRNGELLTSSQSVTNLLEELRERRPPFMCQFIGNNGFNLTVGIDHDFGCIQHSSSDGIPPCLMAIESKSNRPDGCEMEFLVAGTPTPIDSRYRLSFNTVKTVVAEFVASGIQSSCVVWEEF